LYTRDKMASTPEEAVRIAVMAGLDMSMVPFGFSFHDHCVNLSNKDANFLNRVNDAVSRILSVKNQIGLFDNLGKDSYPDPKLLKNVGTNYSWSFNLDAARECIILAKNQDILPLAKSGIKILITGTSGNSLRVLNGGWSYSWQGNREDLFKLFAQKSLTLLQAIQKKAISNVINYVEGANFTNVIDINDVLEQANQSDVIILCIGEDTYAEVLGNIDNLYLDRAQQQLADAVLSLGKDIIVVYLGGRPRIITSIVENENVKGVLLSLLPGNRGAEAIVDIIFGDYNPNARLPITWPRNANGQTPYDLRPLEMYAPNKYEYLYPFGFGLSYTKFNYSNLILSSTTVDYVSGVDVSVRVKNVGSCSGKEIVILYLEDVVASISRPIKQVFIVVLSIKMKYSF
jgi:beta-glucosidase